MKFVRLLEWTGMMISGASRRMSNLKVSRHLKVIKRILADVDECYNEEHLVRKVTGSNPSKVFQLQIYLFKRQYNLQLCMQGGV